MPIWSETLGTPTERPLGRDGARDNCSRLIRYPSVAREESDATARKQVKNKKRVHTGQAKNRGGSHLDHHSFHITRSAYHQDTGELVRALRK